MTYRTIRSIIENQEVVSAAGATTVREAARLMNQHGVGALMIVEDGKLTGVFTERDVMTRVVAADKDPRVTRLAEVMTRDPLTVHPDRPFPEALHLMHEHGFRHVPVVENGRAVGVVSTRDALGPELEDFIYELLRRNQANDILA
ncbi:MAG: CBS domain-containing protein [Burkholderiales bacterium]|nr:CBS domain-containing protein [Burkholderiales bacterium]